jgi:hypothetical protein
MFVCCECCVLSGRDLCDELITHPEKSYRMSSVVVWDLETSWMRKTWLTGACCAKNKISRRVRIFACWILPAPCKVGSQTATERSAVSLWLSQQEIPSCSYTNWKQGGTVTLCDLETGWRILQRLLWKVKRNFQLHPHLALPWVK